MSCKKELGEIYNLTANDQDEKKPSNHEQRKKKPLMKSYTCRSLDVTCHHGEKRKLMENQLQIKEVRSKLNPICELQCTISRLMLSDSCELSQSLPS